MKPLAELSDDELAALARRAGSTLPDAPPWLVETAVAMWRAPAPRPTLGRRIAAVLGFDSWAHAPTLALRSGAPAAVRQLLFTAQGRDVDLRVSPAAPAGEAPRFTVAGQVLGPGEGGQVRLGREGEPDETAPLDEFGEFRFDGVAAGLCRLLLAIGDDEIELPPLQIGGEPGGGQPGAA